MANNVDVDINCRVSNCALLYSLSLNAKKLFKKLQDCMITEVIIELSYPPESAATELSTLHKGSVPAVSERKCPQESRSSMQALRTAAGGTGIWGEKR